MSYLLALLVALGTFSGGYVAGVAVTRTRAVEREARAWVALARRDRARPRAAVVPHPTRRPA